MTRWILAFLVGAHGCAAYADDKSMTRSESASEVLPAATSRRLALVIGNKDYRVVSPLWSPVEDAKAWGEALEAAGFSVSTCYDCTRREMKAKVETFRREIRAGDEAFFYYSGHGAEQDDRNLLFPVDAEINTCGDLDDWSVSLNSVLSAMERARVRIVVLDACRNSPFPTCTKGSANLFAEQDIKAGTLIAYATRRGYTAEDGSGMLSPYTRMVLPRAMTPGLPFLEALTLAREEISRVAKGQDPFESNNLSGKPWALIPGPHPQVHAALQAEAEQRQREADEAWRAITGLPEGQQKYHAVVSYLRDHGGSKASSVLLATRWLEEYQAPASTAAASSVPVSKAPGPRLTPRFTPPPDRSEPVDLAGPARATSTVEREHPGRRDLAISAGVATLITGGLWWVALANEHAIADLEEKDRPLNEEERNQVPIWQERANGFGYAAQGMTVLSAGLWAGVAFTF